LNANEQQEDERRNWETRIFAVKNVDLQQLDKALSVFNVVTKPVPDLGVMSVRAPRDMMPAIEAVIQQLDVPAPPRKTIELTVYLLRSTDQTTSSIPPALEPVVNQLTKLFSYKGFELIDTQIVRAMDGRPARNQGTLGGLALAMPQVPNGLAVYDFSFTPKLRAVNQAQSIVLQDMVFSIRLGYDMRISSDVEVPVGQQVVVGKTTVGQTALILVISAKI
jgi:hypothetical protein